MTSGTLPNVFAPTRHLSPRELAVNELGGRGVVMTRQIQSFPRAHLGRPAIDKPQPDRSNHESCNRGDP